MAVYGHHIQQHSVRNALRHWHPAGYDNQRMPQIKSMVWVDDLCGWDLLKCPSPSSASMPSADRVAIGFLCRVTRSVKLPAAQRLGADGGDVCGKTSETSRDNLAGMADTAADTAEVRSGLTEGEGDV